MPILRVNQVDYYYELHGKGQPLVLITGYCCDHQIWLPILDKLSQQFQLLLLDNRGIGQTKDNGEPLSITTMAEDTIALCQRLGLSRPSVAGHSMGGMIAQCMAAKYPAYINKLAILSSTAKLRQAPLLAFKSMLAMREQNVDFDLLFNTMLPWVYGQAFLTDTTSVALLRKLYGQLPLPQSVEDQARQCLALERFDGREQLGGIVAETLVLHGQQDLIALLEEANYLVDNIHNARLVEIDCAHALVSEAPVPLLKVLSDFFG